MFLKPKSLLLLITLLAITWTGWNIYGYFFDTSSSTLDLAGIQENSYYSGTIQCQVQGNHHYKVSDISVWLDDKPLVCKFKINRRSFQHPIPLDSTQLANGNHIIKVELTDGTQLQHKTMLERSFNVDNQGLQAAFVRPESENRVFQGRTLHIQFQANKEIKTAKAKLLTKEYLCFPESKNSSLYECFVPISHEETPNEYLFCLDIQDHVGNRTNLEGKFQVVAFPFKKQHLKVNPEKLKAEVGLPMQRLEEELEALAKQSPRQKLWRGSFDTPVDVTGISTEFGVVRTTQERGKYAHNAVDLLSAPKCAVWAAQDGIVVLKNRYIHSGNTVVIDHGWGILTLYFHLDTLADINVGDKIKKGNPLGTLGMTGYAQGYHLHWEMRIDNIQVDPMQWTKADF